MTHQQTDFLVPGADRAVLFIHGIVGCPAHFRQLVDLQGAVPEGWSVVNLCLPGHGGRVMDFGRSSMKQWKAHVWAAFERLAQDHRKIVIVGHSMGTLFALQLAVQYPDRVSGLFLLQCPLQIRLRWFGVKNLLRIPFGRISQADPYGAAMLLACGVTPEKNVLKYATWIPRMAELFREISVTRRCLPEVSVPTAAYQSRLDEMVSNRSARILRDNSVITVVEMADSSHFYYAPEDKARMLKNFEEITA